MVVFYRLMSKSPGSRCHVSNLNEGAHGFESLASFNDANQNEIGKRPLGAMNGYGDTLRALRKTPSPFNRRLFDGAKHQVRRQRSDDQTKTGRHKTTGQGLAAEDYVADAQD